MVNGALPGQAGGGLDETDHHTVCEGLSSHGVGLETFGTQLRGNECSAAPNSARATTECELPHLQVQTPAHADNTPTAATARNNRSRTKKRINKKTKAHLTIASLNMRGAGTSAPLDPSNKWAAINHLLRD